MPRQHPVIPQLYFGRIVNDPRSPIKIGASTTPKGDMIRLALSHYHPLEVIRAKPCEWGELNLARVKLEPHHIRNGWYRPSPEVLDYIEAGWLPGDETARNTRKRGRKLEKEEVLEIFRQAHESSLSYDVIGAAFNVGAVMVGRIARGQAHAELFDRTAPDSKGEYYVSEAREDAARYRMTVGVRGAK